MLTRLIMVIILQYIHISNYYGAHLKLIYHMLIISQLTKKCLVGISPFCVITLEFLAMCL